MSIRTINYDVSPDGISPAAQQFGGVQGDHNITELIFTLNTSLLESIWAETEGRRVVYRFDAYDGTGFLYPTAPAALSDEPCVYSLENRVTRYGGNVQVCLVITQILDDETQAEMYSFPAVLKLKSRPYDDSESERYKSLSALAEAAENSADKALESAKKAEVSYSSINSKFIQDAVATNSNYYKTVTALNPNKTYNLEFAVNTADSYTIQAGTSGSVSSMVDTVGIIDVGENGKALIKGYTPTGAYTHIRIDKNVEWSLKVYEKIDISTSVTQLESDVSTLKSNIQNTPKFVNVKSSVFAQEPYNNYIGNLGLNTISNIIPSHNAIDYPLGESGYYTVMTCGDTSSPIQIAVRLDGKIFARKKSTSGWKNWNADAVNFTNLLLTNTAKYSDFNDFPIGSIIGVSENARLENAPDGFNNTGHDGMDVGGIIANVITFATSYSDPYIKSQIAVYYRQNGKPRIAFRSAIYFSSAYHWSEWSIVSQDGSIASTNKIVDINHLDYTFDDFNDAPLNTIYQVDLNVANFVANNPSPGHSGSLMTYCFSNSVRHAVVQEFVTIEDGRAREYIRYGYINSGDVVSWTDWEKLVTERQTTDIAALNTWEYIKNAVRLGLGEKRFPVGYEFTTEDSVTGAVITWVVRGHNHHAAANDKLEHTMTLEAKYVYSPASGIYKDFTFDATEALYYAAEELPAGTYNFTLLAGYDTTYGGGKTLSFTLTKPVPAGGVIMFPWAYNTQSTVTKISTYANNAATAAIESVAVTEAADGTSLGTADGKTENVNHTHRIRYGSNNYAQSAVRQWLNSDAAAGAVWAPSNIFDRPPSWNTSYSGFMRGLPADFLAAVQPAIVPCRTNSIAEVNSLDGTEFVINQVYELQDKFFLLSRPEIYGTWDSSTYKDGELLEFYEGFTDTERIKYDAAGSARYAWLRSPHPSSAYSARIVGTDGTLGTSHAYIGLGVAPACIIA